MAFLEDGNIWDYKELVLEKITIIDVAKEYGLDLLNHETGSFTHQTYCPFHSGKNGSDRERTPSMFFSKDTNSFSCFGCNKAGSIIDFVSFMDGSPPKIALIKLAKKTGLVKKDGTFDDIKISEYDPVKKDDTRKEVELYIFKISKLIRDYLQVVSKDQMFKDNYHRWFDSFSLFLIKVDKYIKESSKDLDKMKKLHGKIRNKLDGGEL